MVKNEKIYKVASVVSFILHIFIFLFVVIVGFLPFFQKVNFYECFVGFFSDALSAWQPYFVLAILGFACLGAFLSIKHPLFSFLTLICVIWFFVIATLPITIEAMIVGFSSPWIGGSVSPSEIGFDLICKISYIVYFDLAFLIYSIVTFIIRAKRNF